MRRTPERKTQSRCTINELLRCGSGGTGRRARLRILWPKGLAGSTPVSRTKISDTLGINSSLLPHQNFRTGNFALSDYIEPKGSSPIFPRSCRTCMDLGDNPLPTPIDLAG